MKNGILLAGAAFFAFGGVAIAQDAAPAPATDSAAPADAAAPAPASDPAPAAPADAAAPAVAPTTATTAAATPAADPAKQAAAEQTVKADWAKYDTGNKGSLTPLEFGNWVLAAQGNDMTAQVEKSRQGKKAGLPAVKVLNATSAAFSKADANKDHMISPDELVAFLAA